MIEANNLIIPIAGALIAGMAAVLFFIGKKFLESWQTGMQKIELNIDSKFDAMTKLIESVRDDIEELRLEYHLIKSHNNDMESRTEMRFQGNERQISDTRERITHLEKRVSCIESEQQISKILHHKNHPEDKFNG